MLKSRNNALGKRPPPPAPAFNRHNSCNTIKDLCARISVPNVLVADSCLCQAARVPTDPQVHCDSMQLHCAVVLLEYKVHFGRAAAVEWITAAEGMGTAHASY